MDAVVYSHDRKYVKYQTEEADDHRLDKERTVYKVKFLITKKHDQNDTHYK